MTALLALFFALGAAAQPASPSPEEAFLSKTHERLKALVRLDTSNPPGNEILAADYLKGELDADGIESHIYTSTGTRASLIARVKGRGRRKPIILMCHTDVVPADRSEWATDPFTPVEKDGYLYGRGTADIKCMCAVEASILTWLKTQNVKLERDVVLLAEADEETGERARHIDWLLKNHGDELDGEFGVNEGGNTIWAEGRVSEIRVQTAEKEYMDLTLIAHGQAGHPSVPRADNSVALLSRAVSRLFEYRFAARMTPVVREFLLRERKSADSPLAAAIQDVLDASAGPDLERAADNLSLAEPEFGAMLRDTLVPTMLKAGYKSNVIPAEARATLNARLLPGTKPEDFVAEVQRVVDDPSVTVLYEPPTRAAVSPMPVDTALYRAAEAQAGESAPGAKVVPFMAAWTTDSQDLRARGVVVYGIDPPLTDEDGERVHGANERVKLDALDWYARYLRGIVLRLAQ